MSTEYFSKQMLRKAENGNHAGGEPALALNINLHVTMPAHPATMNAYRPPVHRFEMSRAAFSWPSIQYTVYLLK